MNARPANTGPASFGNQYSMGPEARAHDCVHAAPTESVDNWPLAIAISDTLGGTPVYRHPPAGVAGDGKPPLETDMPKFDGRLPRLIVLRRTSPRGIRLGQLDGEGRFKGLTSREELPAG